MTAWRGLVERSEALQRDCMIPPDYFESIRQSAVQRWEFLDANPDVAGPWQQLFHQVTQSPRYVISELMQNADDARATQVRVRIEDDTFIFEHDGQDFTEDQFQSLCRFGYSNKRTLQTVGFRGIGFKSTFSLGNEIHLSTPTLSVVFRRERFTVPEWEDETVQHGSLGTRVSVRLKHEGGRKAIESSIENWTTVPVSLVFLNHVREFCFPSRSIRWESLRDGPVPNSQWIAIDDQPEHPLLLIRSETEPFPEEALAEIREERLLGTEEVVEFPPCRVSILLGTKPRLYSVLPAGVDTTLPFASDAPFIQNPSRESVKDPDTSPTNRWLLGRIGNLAGSALLEWLSNTALSPGDRAQAYDLMPDVDRSDRSIGGVCSTMVEVGFEEAVGASQRLLTQEGTVVGPEECVCVPTELQDLWRGGESGHPLDARGRTPMAREVSTEARLKLVNWKWIDELNPLAVLEALKRPELFRPRTWKGLLTLWSYILPALSTYRSIASPKDLNIFPVQGREHLVSAKALIRLSERRLLQSDDDWTFLSEHLLVLNPKWTRFLADTRRQVERSEADKATANALDAADALLRHVGLVEASDAGAVVNKVAEQFFIGESLPISGCVRLAQIAAKLDVTAGSSMRFVTRGKTLRAASEGILFDEDGTLEELVPPSRRDSLLLHHAYTDAFQSCTKDEWLRWVTAGKSGLRRFPELHQTRRSISSRAQAEQLARDRGHLDALFSSYSSPTFQAYDWDFPEDYWVCWTEAVAAGEFTWDHLVRELLRTRGLAYLRESGLIIMEVASNGYSQQAARDLKPAWLVRLSELPCLRDTFGRPRIPRELFRRTESTEPLLDVEPFVERTLDTEANAKFLTALGVRSTPDGPDRILERIEALSGVADPPGRDLDKLYQHLDRLLDDCSTEQLQQVREAFSAHPLIYASDGTWQKSGGVYLAADDTAAPVAALIRPSLAELALWRRVGVAARPTADSVIEWLSQLPSGSMLTTGDAARVRAVQARYPVRIWQECEHWLNLAGEWAPATGLRYVITMYGLLPWSHLHSHVKRVTADCQSLTREAIENSPLSDLPLLADHIRNSPSATLRSDSARWRPPWIASVAHQLSRIRLESDEETVRVRTRAQRLAATTLVNADQLVTTPTLDGVPVGASRHTDVLWVDTEVFVEGLSGGKLARRLPEELGEAFARPEIKAALDYSVDRPDEQVAAYFRDNFTLDAAPADSEPDSGQVRPPGIRQHGEGTEGTPPAPDESPQLGPSSADWADRSAAEMPDSSAPADSGSGGTEAPWTEQPESRELAQMLPTGPQQPRKATAGPSLIERWAVGQGMNPDGEGSFRGPDGKMLVRRHGEVFPWAITQTGATVRRIWAREGSLEQGLEISHEVWRLVELHPESTAIVLLDGNGAPVTLTGGELTEMVRRGSLVLHPASYRLTRP